MRREKVFLGEDVWMNYNSQKDEIECYDCGVPIHTKPTNIIGDYKVVALHPSTNDNLIGTIEVWLTKYDTLLNKRDTIGVGSIILAETDTNYHEFSFPVIYSTNTVFPDTLIFALGYKAWWGSGDTNEYPPTCGNCFYVYFDNIKLEETLGLNELDTDKKQGNLLIHPNPFDTELNLFNNSDVSKQVNLYQLNGMLIESLNLAPFQQIRYNNAGKLPSGTYIISDQKQRFKLIKLKAYK
jgi:hypothetical protein